MISRNFLRANDEMRAAAGAAALARFLTAVFIYLHTLSLCTISFLAFSLSLFQPPILASVRNFLGGKVKKMQ